jgi:hypothetical protein
VTDFAVNDAGDVLAFDGKDWKPAQVAMNDKGEKVAFDGKAWRPLNGQQVGPNVNEGMQNAFGNSLAFGFGDELKAGLRATAAPAIQAGMKYLGGGAGGEDFQKSPMGQASAAPDWSARYNEELTKERERAKAFEASNPNLAAASNVAGSVAGSTAALAALPAGVTAAGPSLVGNVAKLAATGGGLAGLQGFGEGEGGLGARLSNAVIPAVVGVLTGGGIPVGGALARKALETGPGRYVSEKVISPIARLIAGGTEGVAPKSLSAAAPDGSAGVQGPIAEFAERTGNQAETGAIERLTTSLQRSGMTPEQITAKLKTLGPEAVLADADPQFLSAAQGVKVLPGETRSLAKNVLEGRDRQAGNRLTTAFEGNEPPPSAFALRGEGQAFDENARAVGADAYGAMADQKLRLSGEMQKIMADAPDIGKALKTELAQNAGTGTKLSPIELMDRVKQRLNKGADAAFNSGTVVNKADIGAMADRFEKAFWRANPGAEEAATRFAQAKSLPGHFDVGAALLAREGTSEPALEKSAARLTELLAKADPQQKLATRVGATTAARNQAQESTALARALAKRVDESAPVQSKIAQLYEPGHAAAITKQAAAERQFAETSNKLLGGSQTAEKTADALETNAGIRISNSSASARVFEHLGDIYHSLVSGNEPVRDAIGRATLNMDPSEKARLVRLIAANLARRQQGSPLAASLAGSSGNLIPSSR